MRQFIYLLFCLLALGLSTSVHAHINPEVHKARKANSEREEMNANLRQDCQQATQQIDLKINNVRSRLLNGGDVWWDLDIGKYVVPSVDPASGQPEVSSIFAGAVWMGGLDPGGNLKLACQDYRSASANDFWPGPLTPDEGLTDEQICRDWDRFWRVSGDNVLQHRNNWAEALAAGQSQLDPADISEDIRGWPARGNRFFFELNGFDLPNNAQGLGAFWDENENGFYEPDLGDFPLIEIRGCEPSTANQAQFPDEMIFWIYNDNGNVHTQTNGLPIRMEVQVQAFAYSTSDEINDMTFQRYKLINRAPESIDSFYFAMWVDPDLGCHLDDYVGCDTARSLAYVYNQDAADGDPGTQCQSFSGPVETYGTNVPYLGIDYFRGPLGPKVFNSNGQLVNPNLGEPFDTIIELGMTSFTYYNNGGTFTGPAAQTDPQQPQEFYNFLTGSWRDGTPFTEGGSGFNVGSQDNIDFAFPDPPNSNNGWSMCTSGLGQGDRRTIQASGPLRLDPGAVNELIIGVVWVGDVPTYPCPDMNQLFQADEVAQALFDNCFDITDGPDAPDVDWVELDREIVGVLTNDPETSNNAFEAYSEVDLRAGSEAGEDTLYFFQGYKVFQLAGPDVGVADLDDPAKAQLVFQVDINDSVGTIYNWFPVEDPGGGPLLFMPQPLVEGENQGIRHTFRINEDRFATADRRLINHKKYYYVSLAYAYNNWQQFDPEDKTGQRFPYLQGRRNVQTYTVIPRPITDQVVQADYGDGVEITRIEGVGAGGNFLDLAEGMHEAILDGSFDGEVDYEQGAGPIDVQVYNPLEAQDGEYILTIEDENLADDELNDSLYWKLIPVNDPDGTILSDRTLDQLNEQIVACFGFSVTIGQTDDVGDLADETNGAIGYEESYASETLPQWFAGFPDQDASFFFNTGVGNFIRTDEVEENFALDPNQALSNIGPGFFFPYVLCEDDEAAGPEPYITPGWVNNRNPIVVSTNPIENLNNVDIVFTSDKSKWSRCAVVETATLFYTDIEFGLGLETEGNRNQMDLRDAPSVDKDGMPDGDGVGMGWFPGYAVDVETGKRLNIFFGENSAYVPFLSDEYEDGGPTTRDMIWNPTAQVFLPLPRLNPPINLPFFFLGGQHYVYVTNAEYDSCAFIREKLDPEQNPNDVQKTLALRQVTWAGIPLLAEGEVLNSIEDGLIPNDLTVKLRVDNPYAVEEVSGDYNGYPTYRFRLNGVESQGLDNQMVVDSMLDLINVVPNPYLGQSAYETSQFTTTVKITNLPAKCTVSIYSLDGKFIRQYNRDEQGVSQATRPNPGIKVTQVTPDIEWDLRNSSGIPIASGVYLIHIDAPGLGERVLKWFGVNRQFDPSGL